MGKTEKGLEGIEKKTTLAKTRPNFIVRALPCEWESSLRLLPCVVNKICLSLFYLDRFRFEILVK